MVIRVKIKLKQIMLWPLILDRDRAGIGTTTVAIIVVVLIAAAALGYYLLGTSSGSTNTTSSTSVKTVQVVIPAGTNTTKSLNYQPATITVVLGVNSSITWVNQDTSIHTVIANDSSFSSGDIQPGSSFSHSFTSAGTFDYYCKYHSWMRGVVVVKTAA